MMLMYRTRVIPHVMTERTKPVTALPAPSSSAIYDVHVYEPHKGTHTDVSNYQYDTFYRLQKYVSAVA